MRPWGRRGVALAATVTLLAGCTGGSEDTGGDGTAGDGSAAGRIAEPEMDDTLAAATAVMPQDPRDQVDVGVRSLEVEGTTMVLRLVLVPRFGSESSNARISLYDLGRVTGVRPTLLDEERRKRYRVVRASGEDMQSDSLDTEVVNGSPMEVFYVFAAPPPEVDALDLQIPSWPTFLDIPVAR